MDAVAEVSGVAEARILIDNPDRRLGAVEPVSPRDYGAVQALDSGLDDSKGVKGHRDNLSDLIRA